MNNRKVVNGLKVRKEGGVWVLYDHLGTSYTRFGIYSKPYKTVVVTEDNVGERKRGGKGGNQKKSIPLWMHKIIIVAAFLLLGVMVYFVAMS